MILFARYFKRRFYLLGVSKEDFICSVFQKILSCGVENVRSM